MVAHSTHYHIPVLWNVDISHQWIGYCTIHLHTVLMRRKSLESVLVLVLLFLIAYMRFNESWIIYSAIGILVASLLSKKILLLLGRLWLGFANYLAVVMNHIILFLVFFLILVPLAFFQRLAGANQITKKRTPDSYFHRRNHTYSLKDLAKPW